MTVVRETLAPRGSVLHVKGDLRSPLNGALRRQVQALIDRGERNIVLDLARLSDIDAAGIGELVRVYNMLVSANGTLQIAHAQGTIRRILERVGLFSLLAESDRAPGRIDVENRL
jgi:anti-anti-sigma factor